MTDIGEHSSAVPARRASELGLRVASSLVLALVALFATAVGGWIFALLWLLAGGAVLFEWIAMTKAEPGSTLQVVLAGGLVALAASAFAGASPLIAAAICGAALVAAAALGRSWRDRGWAAAGFAYAAVIAVVPPLVREHPRLGLVAILWMFAVVWLTDIAAYFAGRRFGGPKLWPRVSPKKTWSGFFGGLVAGVAAGGIVVLVAGRFGVAAPVSFAIVVLLSAVASVLSQLGDLGKSALKRRFGAKDSSVLIPGPWRGDGSPRRVLGRRRPDRPRAGGRATAPGVGRMTTVTILGATGSVGRSTVDVLAGNRDRFRVAAVVSGSDAEALARIAREVGAGFAALADRSGGDALREALAGTGIRSGAGAAAVLEAVDRPADIVMAAISGTAGLLPTHAALKSGRAVALANKESLVCAGEAFMRDAKALGASILPVEFGAQRAAAGSRRRASGGRGLDDADRLRRAVPDRNARAHGPRDAGRGLRPPDLGDGDEDQHQLRDPHEQRPGTD